MIKYKLRPRQNAPPRGPPRVKIEDHADVVELVDSLDLGVVTSVKVFRFHPLQETEYAGMMKLVNIQDLGSCAQA